ncbi:MAG: L,D-transpeptidase [Myxococcota bacterium]
MLTRHVPGPAGLRFVLATSLALAAGPASANDELTPDAHDDNGMPTAEAVDPPDTLDPKLRGVAAGDLGIDEGAMVATYLGMKGVLPLTEILSVSAVELHANRMVVDVVGRSQRFVDHDTQRNPKGRVGLMRVTVPLASNEGLCDVGLPEIQWEKSLADLDLHYRVSVGEWVGVMEDPAVGFRRVWPLGGGAIDKGVRVVGVVTSMTPTTEDGLLEKTYAWRQLHSPWYFRDKPYLPISVARVWKKPDGTVSPKFYVESNIAFHIWQDKGFQRGFFSHGCMRMRTEDLAELAAYVFGADDKKPIPVVLRTARITDAMHPWPMETKVYWQLKNYGTPEKPETRLKYMLYETELGSGPLPTAEELTPMSFLEKPIYPDAATATSAPSSPTTNPPTTAPAGQP